MDYNAEDYSFYDIKKAPFKLYGVFYDETRGQYLRMPKEIAQNTSEAVFGLNTNTAGGRIRFKTNADTFVLKASYPDVGFLPNLTQFTQCFFDVYVEEDGRDVFYGVPREGEDDLRTTRMLNQAFSFGNKKEKEITVNFPLYGSVCSVEIGLPKGATLAEHRDYRLEKPVIFYGSSITQGASASRPGICYEARCSRELDFNYINLGFSGSAKAEDVIIDYISSLDMSAFFLDYDHNAPTVEHLQNTHLKTYLKIRKRNPSLPIIITSKPDFNINLKDDTLRRIIVQKTYHYAVEHGDENIYYIDGAGLFNGMKRSECTVDGCHPNDVGMLRMATAFCDALRQALFIK